MESKSTKHTPGPWTIHEFYDHNEIWSGDRDNFNNMICELPYIGGGLEENSKLIAAAPVLLVACEYLTEMAEHTAHGKHNCPEIWDALEKAKSAIAQAKGE